MSARHTPGPWVDDGGTIIGADGSFVSQMDLTATEALRPKPQDTVERMKADGALIAAAPELLEHSKAVIGLLGRRPEGRLDITFADLDVVRGLRDAIAKAEGSR